MHVTEKIVDENGVHILSSTLEADGAFMLASADAKLSANVIAIRRTDSGGVFLQTAVTITEPVVQAPAAPVVVAEPTDDEKALDYLAATGLSHEQATEALVRFGSVAILSKKKQDDAAALDAMLAKKPEPPAPLAGGPEGSVQ